MDRQIDRQIDEVSGQGCEQVGVGWGSVGVIRWWMDWGCDWLGWVEVSCDWAIVCGVCYYQNLLQMQQIHPKPRPRLVMANSADNACYHPNMATYGNKNGVK